MVTEAQVQTMLKDAVDIMSTERVNGTSIDTKVTTLETDALGQDQADLENAIRALRDSNVNVIGQGTSLLSPILATYARVLSTAVPKTDPPSALTAIYNRWMTSGDRITSRQFSRGSPSAGGSNTGSGVMRRLTLDSRTQNIELGFAEVKTFTCTADANTGALQHEEVFSVQGATAAKDGLTVAGSGIDTTITAVSARTSLLGNASFSQYAGTAAVPTDITSWTPTDITKFAIDTSNYYRGFSGDTTPASLQFTDNATITQALSVRGTSLALDTPYFLQVAYNRQIGGSDGTLTITLGSQTTNVVLAAQTGWNLLYLPIDQNLWARNFNQASLSVSIQLSGATTKDLRVDDVLLVPWSQIDGTWWLTIGGATAFSAKSGGDTFTATDTTAASTTAKIQTEITTDFPGFYLPSCYPTASACTAALAGAGAGNIDNGTHSYKIAFIDATGAGAGTGLVSNTVTVADKTTDGKIALTAIPTGPTGTASRKVYRTAAGNAVTGPWKLQSTISDNVTTTLTDNLADAGLGATLSGGVTVTEP